MYIAFLVAGLLAGHPEPSFPELREQIIPSKQELKWRELSWHPTLWDGLLRAQQEGKPILLYTMNGHPLGCT